ncbi:MAG: hypothetical protein ACRERE_45275 [Candidatus Entotheonellia bacterium]
MTSVDLAPCSTAMHLHGFSWLWLNHPSRRELVLSAAAWSIAPALHAHPWLAGFGRGGAPAVAGLLGVTALNLAKQSLTQ